MKCNYFGIPAVSEILEKSQPFSVILLHCCLCRTVMHGASNSGDYRKRRPVPPSPGKIKEWTRQILTNFQTRKNSIFLACYCVDRDFDFLANF